jgi:mono/diheme cytochrome c family protein
MFAVYCRSICSFVAVGLIAGASARAADYARSVDYNRQVLPILSDNCFKCHGPDEKARKAKLRFDTRDGIMRLKDGKSVIAPGKADKSELIRRLTSTDPDTVMPPPKSGRKLTAEQIAMVKSWVEQGAKWETLWSLIPPKSPPLPEVANTSWVRNPIDRLVLARLGKENLKPADEAAKTTLLRRVTLDLTGLPPTPSELDAFLQDQSPDAYEKVVDRLLASPRYGERMATLWLDLARYADTNGYQADRYRPMWPYRDWVISAFNGNLPFDQFATWQLAGDLLPNATKLIDPLGWAEIEGEAFAPGFFLWNSEVGRRSVGIQTFWFQAVCANHIVWDAVEVVDFSRKHTANVHECLREIRRHIEQLVENRDQRRDGFARVMANAFKTSLGDKADDVAKVLARNGIPRDLGQRALKMAEQSSRFTVFSIIDALTRIAGEYQFAGDRAELDQKASGFLALAARGARDKVLPPTMHHRVSHLTARRP